MAVITLKNLRAEARVGILRHELEVSQAVYVTVEAEIDDAHVLGCDDRIDRAVDYRQLRAKVLEVVAHERVHLIETLVARIAKTLVEVDGVDRVRVSLSKPEAFGDCETVELALTWPSEPTHG